MRKYLVLLLLALGWSSMTFAVDKKEAFVQKVKSMQGHYKVAKGSSKCSGGHLSMISGKSEEGFHLGHDIFFGSMSGPMSEKSDDYCAIDYSYNFTENSVTQITKISRCPASLKADESVTTKIFGFKGDSIYYTVKELGLKCEFKKVAQGESHE